MRECYVCGKHGKQKHHIIHGHGKRRACETKESLIDICYDCHRLVHNSDSSHLDSHLKLCLQATYFDMGYNQEEVRVLMGGKLIDQS